jgi:hypothetical protein
MNAKFSHKLAIPPQMRWRVYRYASSTGFTAQWNALNAAAGDLPFLRSEFLAPALREFGTGTEILVTFGAGDDYAAMGMLRRLRPGMWETFQPSQLP